MKCSLRLLTTDLTGEAIQLSRGAALPASLKYVQPKSTPPDEIRQIYRSILRATTYLPDQYARNYVFNYARKRFHKSCQLCHSNDAKHNEQRIKKARRALRTLEGACDGKKDDLKDILMRTYGRIGARRRLLLADLTALNRLVEENNVPKDDSALQDCINNPLAKETAAYEPSAKLFEFLKSQQAHGPAEATGGTIKKLRPVTPKTNIWMRPLPLKLEKSLRAKWWAEVLNKICPPVPLAEWERIKGFATGEVPLEKFPARRAGPPPLDPETRWTDEPTKVLGFLKHRPKCEDVETELVEFDTRFGLRVQRTAMERQERETGRIGPRALRRLYASIWNMTPTMQFDESKNRWAFQWGAQKSVALNGEVTQPSEAQKELFEGLGDARVVNKVKKSRGARSRDRKQAIIRENAASGVQNPLPAS